MVDRVSQVRTYKLGITCRLLQKACGQSVAAVRRPAASGCYREYYWPPWCCPCVAGWSNLQGDHLLVRDLFETLLKQIHTMVQVVWLRRRRSCTACAGQNPLHSDCEPQGKRTWTSNVKWHRALHHSIQNQPQRIQGTRTLTGMFGTGRMINIEACKCIFFEPTEELAVKFARQDD